MVKKKSADEGLVNVLCSTSGYENESVNVTWLGNTVTITITGDLTNYTATESKFKSQNYWSLTCCPLGNVTVDDRLNLDFFLATLEIYLTDIMEESKNKFADLDLQSEDLGERYRCDKVLKLQQDMEKELIKNEAVYKKYKKGDKICTAVRVTSSFVGTVCSTAAVAMATTVVLAAVAIPLAVISGLSYVSAIAPTAVGKK